MATQPPAPTSAVLAREAEQTRLNDCMPWYGFSVIGTNCLCDFGRGNEEVTVDVYFSGKVEQGASGNLGSLKLALNCGTTDYEANIAFPGTCETSTGPVPQNCPWAPYAPLVVSEVGFSTSPPVPPRH
jgi:hypothetical protein